MHLIAAIILVTIVLTAKIANKWSLPLILIALASGIFFGSDVVGLVYFDDHKLAKQIADTALIFVLFAGGFGTKRDSLKLVMGPALVLSTLGILVTALISSVAMWTLLGITFPIACLLGAIISSTDAAAVFSILRTRSLPPKLSSLTEVESATNDPMAVLLTAFIIQIINNEINSPLHIGLSFIWQLSGGAAIGILIGISGIHLFKRVKTIDKGYFYILCIGVILLSFGFADLIKANGMISAFFAGFVMGNKSFPFKRNISAFLDALSIIANVIIFVLLGLLVFPSQLGDVWLQGVTLFLVLTFISRPLTVGLFTMFTRYNLKEKLFLNWSGLRGAVPIVLATYPAAAGIENSNDIFNTIFLAVTLSILVQGTTIGKVADILKLSLAAKPKPDQTMELVTIHESNLDLFELYVDDNLYSGKVTISALTLPPDTTITMINRKENIIAPKGGTTVQPGDILYILTSDETVATVTNEILNKFSKKV
ncbi:MAG TPA: potassium/proton antiporter [Chitinispirillaceae bacterium]|nr:potassium/proton antiporter [Chitinispirillaceae bacterium]